MRGDITLIKFDKLWQTMKKREITTYTLREKYNIEGRTIRRLKANDNVTTDTLNKLCEILNCRLDEIVEYEPDKNESNL